MSIQRLFALPMAILFAVIAGCAGSLPKSGHATSAEITNRDLMRSCATQTMVFNKSGDVVGQKIDSYCRGYLEGTLHALSIQERAACVLGAPVSTEYLLSPCTNLMFVIFEFPMLLARLAPSELRSCAHLTAENEIAG